MHIYYTGKMAGFHVVIVCVLGGAHKVSGFRH